MKRDFEDETALVSGGSTPPVLTPFRLLISAIFPIDAANALRDIERERSQAHQAVRFRPLSPFTHTIDTTALIRDGKAWFQGEVPPTGVI